MAEQVFKSEVGKVAYVTKQGKQFKPGEAEVWTMRFYPKTAADRAAIKATGIKNKINEDDGAKSGLEGLFYTFRSSEAYDIVDAEGNPVDKLIANGSEGYVELHVETFNSAKFGPQARSKLLRVVITNLIEYVPEVKEDSADVPA